VESLWSLTATIQMSRMCVTLVS